MLREAHFVRDQVRGRGGFTLVELTIAVALVAMLAGVLYVQVVGRSTDGQAAALLRNIDSIEDAIAAFRNDVRRYPAQLVHLTVQPPSGALDSCGAVIPTRFRQQWSGPYLNRQVTTAGISSGTSTTGNGLERDEVLGDTAIVVVTQGVDLAVADRIEEVIDVSGGFTAGTVRWQADVATANRGVLRYRVPVRGC